MYRDVKAVTMKKVSGDHPNMQWKFVGSMMGEGLFLSFLIFFNSWEGRGARDWGTGGLGSFWGFTDRQTAVSENQSYSRTYTSGVTLASPRMAGQELIDN